MTETLAPHEPMSLDAVLLERVIDAGRAARAAEARQLATMLEYVDLAAGHGRREDGGRGERLWRSSAVHELSLALNLSPGSVEGRLAVARRVRGTLPRLWAAHLDGQVGAWQVSIVDTQATRLTEPASVAALDEVVVEQATARTPGQLRSWLSRWVERTETDAACQRHALARAERRVMVRSLGDGMALLTAIVTELDAAAIDTRLDSEARSLPSTDPRTTEQARADFLRDLLLGPADGGGVTTVIGVTVPLGTLLGLDDAPGETTDHRASVPAKLVREKAIEPGSIFWRLLTDERGHLLDATYAGRYAPPALRTALAFRDGTTVFPTSDVPAERCDHDHTEAWPAPTTATNLAPLHRRAHRLKTAGLLGLRQDGEGGYEWTTRTRHAYRYRPDPLPT